MKKYLVLIQVFFLAVIMSCESGNQSSGISNDGGAVEPIPAGAEVIGMGDFQKVLVKDGQGKIIEEGSAQNGLKEGAWITYNDVGVPTQLVSYHQGVVQGINLTFDNNGSLTTKAYYNGVNLEGEFRNYKNRNLSEIKTYENGVLHGPHLTFYTNEKVQQEVNYVDGNFDGLARWFNQEGELTIAYVYEDGELVDKNPSLSAEDSVANY